MKKVAAKKTPETFYLPVTLEQFEELTQEIQERLNKLTTPQFVSGDFTASCLISAIHSLPRDTGRYSKDDLFHRIIRQVSANMTYNISKELEKKAKEDVAAQNPEILEAITDSQEAPQVLQS